jgi:hypothetical protein
MRTKMMAKNHASQRGTWGAKSFCCGYNAKTKRITMERRDTVRNVRRGNRIRNQREGVESNKRMAWT